MSLGMRILYCTGYVFVSVVACMLDCLFGLTNSERLPLWFLPFERKVRLCIMLFLSACPLCLPHCWEQLFCLQRWWKPIGNFHSICLISKSILIQFGLAWPPSPGWKHKVMAARYKHPESMVEILDDAIEQHPLLSLELFYFLYSSCINSLNTVHNMQIFWIHNDQGWAKFNVEKF